MAKAKPLALRSEMAGRILTRLHLLGWWPFKDKQFSTLIQNADEGKLEVLAYSAIAGEDTDFRRRLQELIDTQFPKEA